MQKHPTEVKNMLRASYRGLRYIKDNCDKAIGLITTVLRVDRNIAAETFDHVRRLSFGRPPAKKPSAPSIETMGGAADKKVRRARWPISA
jgi:hypothetical protein